MRYQITCDDVAKKRDEYTVSLRPITTLRQSAHTSESVPFSKLEQCLPQHPTFYALLQQAPGAGLHQRESTYYYEPKSSLSVCRQTSAVANEQQFWTRTPCRALRRRAAGSLRHHHTMAQGAIVAKVAKPPIETFGVVDMPVFQGAD